MRNKIEKVYRQLASAEKVETRSTFSANEKDKNKTKIKIKQNGVQIARGVKFKNVIG